MKRFDHGAVRRIVTIDNDRGESMRLHDGPAPDVRRDPARPGYAATRIWVTDSTPARIAGSHETTQTPHALEPPPNGSVCRIVTFPPDDAYIKSVSQTDVAAFFAAMGSPSASTYKPDSPHPYMQKMQTLDMCVVLEGEIVLVLDTAEVQLRAGDSVIQRGTNHAWSNRTDRQCVIAFSMHDARL